MANKSIRNVLVQIGTKFKFWAYMYISAWIVHRIVVALFYHIIIPECYGGGCGLGERFLSFLDPFGPFVLLVFVFYVFLLNLLFVRRYAIAFLCLSGAASGIGTTIIYPSQIDYISQEIVAEMFPALAALASGWVGFSVWILIYLVLFAVLFFLTTAMYVSWRHQTKIDSPK